jgi:ubiquinone/menaquinone biosynthesis C-methylase UbiE
MRELVYRQTRDLEESHWWFLGMREVYRKQLDQVAANEGGRAATGESPRRVLDVGCGTGGNLALLESYGCTYGIDSSLSAAAFTRARGWPRILVGSATELPLPDRAVDLITALGVIEHVPDDMAMLEEMRRVAKPGGHLLLMTSAHRWLWSTHDDAVHHVRRYRRSELERLVTESGWRIEQLTYANAFLFPVIAAVRVLQRLLPDWTSEPDVGMSGFFVPPRPVNQALAGLLSFEGSLMRLGSIPFGVGLIVRASSPYDLATGSL